jgi:hypothetical protein
MISLIQTQELKKGGGYKLRDYTIELGPIGPAWPIKTLLRCLSPSATSIKPPIVESNLQIEL